jgi:hypothetical protein
MNIKLIAVLFVVACIVSVSLTVHLFHAHPHVTAAPVSVQATPTEQPQKWIDKKGKTLIVPKGQFSRTVEETRCPDGFIDAHFYWEDPKNDRKMWSGEGCFDESYIRSISGTWTCSGEGCSLP